MKLLTTTHIHILYIVLYFPIYFYRLDWILVTYRVFYAVGNTTLSLRCTWTSLIVFFLSQTWYISWSLDFPSFVYVIVPVRLLPFHLVRIRATDFRNGNARLFRWKSYALSKILYTQHLQDPLCLDYDVRKGDVYGRVYADLIRRWLFPVIFHIYYIRQNMFVMDTKVIRLYWGCRNEKVEFLRISK